MGALLLDTSENALKLGSYLAWEIRVPMVVVGQQVPEALRHIAAEAISAAGELLSAVQNLLVLALNPPQPSSPMTSAQVA